METMTAPSPTARRIAGHLGVAWMVMVASLFTAHSNRIEPSWQVLTFTAACAVVLVWRHRFPRAVYAVVAVAALASVPIGLFSGGSTVAVAVATYAVVLVIPRRPALWLGAAGGVAMLGAGVWAGDFSPQHLFVVLLGGAIGQAVQAHRANLAALTQRAERAEATREALARQRVAEERLAIARDLHDVVAHQIAVINLHAGAAAAAVDERPDDAKRSLGIVREAARSVLGEIGDLLATLRDPGTAAPVGLAQLDDLVRDQATHGTTVTVRTDGTPYELSANVDVAALRVVQEALTNAHKHASVRRAHVRLQYTPASLRITVSSPADADSPSSAGAPSTGHGLVGMRERVESVRGTLTYGRTGTGLWLVTAELPTAGSTTGNMTVEAP
jgi:signal transduction histidine kinase